MLRPPKRYKILLISKFEDIPHPREEPANLEHIVKNISTTVRSAIVTENEKSTILSDARAVIGMSSILLYECWLSGLPVLSLQLIYLYKIFATLKDDLVCIQYIIRMRLCHH